MPVEVTTEEMAVGMLPHRFTLLARTSACSPVRVLQVTGMVEERAPPCRFSMRREDKALYSVGRVPPSPALP